MDLASGRGPAAGCAAAHVHPVAGVGEQREQFAVDKVWRDKNDVVEMGAACVGIVEDPDVPRSEAAAGIGDRDQVLHGELHVSEEHRQAVAALRDRFAGHRIIQPVCTIIGFGYDRRDRGADQMQIHFIGNLFERAAHDGECDRIHHATSTRMLL